MSLSDVVVVAVSFACGLLLWTLLEYVMHRFAYHEGRFGKSVSTEHLNHHARPHTFTTAQHKLTLAVPALCVIFTIFAAGFGLLISAGITAGTFTGWVFFETLHRITHVWPPRNAYGAWARRHHLFHHCGSARMNHGVTTPMWDWAFGTLHKPTVVLVPRRMVHAFAWLLDEDGAVAPRFASAYRLT